jgi:GDP-L-fucose synthase
MLEKDTKIYVAGHRGMVGAAICRLLTARGFNHIVFRTHEQLDLTQQVAVREFMQVEKPGYIVLAAAKVGGIHVNNVYPAEFIYKNLMIEANILHEGFVSGCRNLLFLGSSCIYPKSASQPMTEDALLTGILESTNEPYAIAKIAGIKLCESYNRQYGVDYRAVMPTNLYGQGDNFHAENSHVIPALIRRFHEAKLQDKTAVTIWGSGKPMREFLHVDDMASACFHIMSLMPSIYQQHTQPMLSHINVGTGVDCSIYDLAETIARIVGFNGQLVFDTTKPDGTARKLMNVSRLKSLGWEATIPLEDGLRRTYQWFLDHQATYRGGSELN